jgi:hypothetical protein
MPTLIHALNRQYCELDDMKQEHRVPRKKINEANQLNTQLCKIKNVLRLGYDSK